MVKKIIYGTLGGTVAGIIISMIFFMGIYGGMAEQWMQDYAACLKEQNYVWWIIGSLLFSLFLTILLYKFGVSNFKGGAIAGAWIFFLMTLSYGIMNASTYTAYPWSWLPYDILGNVVTGALAGGVVGWILGKVK
jgi:hypothetical protein